MANSIDFNGNDLSGYGLVLTHGNPQDFQQLSDSQQIEDIAYSFNPKHQPRVFRLDVDIIAATRATLDGYLDSIKAIIVTEAAAALKFDTITDRYWMAKLDAFTGGYRAKGWFAGVMILRADDPLAYDNTEVDSPHVINAPATTVVETTEGTGYINPVYTLTAKENLGAITIKLENISTDEELQWTGTLTTNDELEIDVANWTVKKNDVDDMDITGQFPRLAPNMANSIKVTALFSAVNGELDIVYRNRYL